MSSPAATPRRTCVVVQGNTSLRFDGTLPLTITPARDGSLAFDQGGTHSELLTSAPLAIGYKGSWPADPPPPPPPTGTLRLDLSGVSQSSPQFARFKAFVDLALSGHPDYGFSATDAAYMFKITGDARYAQLAVQTAEAQVAAAEAAIAAGHNPDVAGDSYLQVGPMIGDVAIAMAWCAAAGGLTAQRAAAWSAYMAQTVFNVWHPTQAAWGGRSAPWSGWAINDPANNYYYSFIRATMFYALAVNDATLLAYLRTDRLPLLTNFYATIPGGGSLEGTGYGTSHMVLFELYQFWKDSTGEDLGALSTHLANSIRFWIGATMPSLDRFMPIGDQSRVSEPTIYDYQRRLVVEGEHLTTDSAAKRDADWWLSAIINGSAGQDEMQQGFNTRYNLIPHAAASTPPAARTFRAPEVGLISGRESFGTDAVAAFVLMGNYSQSHAHQEQGGFTLFWHTWLAVTNNIWSHSGINQTTIDKNVVRFERAGAVQPQRQNHSVDVLGYSANPATGEFHVVGDLTAFYDASAGVHSWTRGVDFVGGVLTVTDVCDLAAGTTATFQVNTPVEPTISGNIITAGSLKITAPVGATISKLDMRTVAEPGDGTRHYAGGWRIDIAGANNYAVRFEVIR